MLWRKPPEDLAKVGVEGSNPFARSISSQENQADKAVTVAALPAWGHYPRNAWPALSFGFSARCQGFKRHWPWQGLGPRSAG